MPSTRLLPTAATRTSSAAPNTRLGNDVTRLLVQQNVSASFLKFDPPEAARGRTITVARLTLQPLGDGWNASRALTLTPHERFDYRTITANNQPATLSAPAALTDSHSGTSAWNYNTLAHAQAWSAGSFEFEGWKITTTSTTELRLGGMGDQYAAVWYWEWLDEPQPPTGLIPDGGGVTALTKPYLSWDSAGPGLTSVQVQFGTEDPGTGAWTTSWDSGTVASSVPGLDLSTTTYPGASGAVQWRAREIWSDRGDWTAWSDPADWQQVPYPSLTLLALDATADPNPARAWSTSTQHAARLTRYGSVTGREVVRSPILGPSVRIYEPDIGATKDGQGFRDVLEVLDRPDRLSLPGAPRWQTLEDSWTYTANATSPVVVSVSMLPDSDPNLGNIPVGRIIIDCSQVPDNLIVFRGFGLKPIQIDADTTSPFYVGIVNGNARYSVRTYEWPPNTAQDVAVVAIVGTTRKAPVRVALTLPVEGMWLQHLADDGTVTRIVLHGPPNGDGVGGSEWATEEIVNRFQLANGRTVLHRMGRTGLEGTLDGWMVPQGSLSIEAQYASWERLRELAEDGEAIRVVGVRDSFWAHLVNMRRLGPVDWASTKDIPVHVACDVIGIPEAG